ncbi:Uma2 family endonuclease [Nodosilinea sp. P-1105]|uniref:Uma2 family endonuclease n=1 Tax=Nodosilinea sp. P-1105 TaxID=2546229 RepID=UPI00146B0A49|nr:Uma2 family endonuclease [Nodosilinea sp. P-1105]NMF86199.1 Uma2 family endonuclease [Nodosilinea sp. P-1105]
MVQISAKTITLAEFLQQPETKPAREYIDGQIIQKPMPQGQHSTIQGELVTAINAVTKPGNIAWAFPELRCTFGGRSIIPDVSVFRWQRLPTNDNGTIANTFNAAPDWTIEILSPEQSSTRVVSNILHCLNHGGLGGWLIDPDEQLVQVYRPDQLPASLEVENDTLTLTDLAPTLVLTVGQVFGWLRVG